MSQKTVMQKWLNFRLCKEVDMHMITVSQNFSMGFVHWEVVWGPQTCRLYPIKYTYVLVMLCVVVIIVPVLVDPYVTLPILFRITFIVAAVSGVRVAVPSIAIWGMLCQKQISRARTSNCIPQIMWDVITCPCHWYVNTVAVWNNRDSFAPACRYGTLFVSNLQRALRI